MNVSNPLSKFPGSERLAASYELLYRLGKEYKKPEFGIRAIRAYGSEVVIFESIKLEKPFCKLIHFKRYSDDAVVINQMKNDPTILLVAPLSGHHSTLLRDTVATLLQDHNVFITDWVDASFDKRKQSSDFLCGFQRNLPNAPSAQLSRSMRLMQQLCN